MKNEQPRVVSLSDLGQLTLRGNVAFAVRCAQRIRPSFQLPADAARRREQYAAVDGAIRVATAFCTNAPPEPGRAAAAVRLAAVVAEETYEYTNFAGFGALRAAEAVEQAEKVLSNAKDASVTEVVAAAFGAGRVLAANTDCFSLDIVANALYADLTMLLSLAGGSIEDLGPTIDPSESGPLGPLWAAGRPLCFAAAAESPSEGV